MTRSIHVLSHVVSYGSSVFEGIRCYATPPGPAIFRLREHVRRMARFGQDLPHGQRGLLRDRARQAMLELVRVNRMPSCYIRPIVMRGYGEMGVNPLKNPVDVYIACWEWGKYLGEEALAEGVDVCVSSWNRLAPNTLPSMAKAGANYMNSQLIKMEALSNGYSEGIALDAPGYVSEGSGENIFVVRDGKIVTPPLGASVLPGITRDRWSGWRTIWIFRWWRRSSRARCCILPTRSSFPARRRRSRPSARSTGSRSAKGGGARSRSGCRKNFSGSSMGRSRTGMDGCRRCDSPKPEPCGQEIKDTAQPEPATSPEICRPGLRRQGTLSFVSCSATGKPERYPSIIGLFNRFICQRVVTLTAFLCGKPVNKTYT